MTAATRVSRDRVRARTALVITSVLTLVGSACTPPAPSGAAAVVGRPECPRDSIHVTLIDSTQERPVPVTITEVPVAGDISHVPEYHDCQRLAVGNGPTYGPLVAVFASYQLDSLFREGGRGHKTIETSKAAAEILSYDGEYRPLHIMPGFSCLYLWEPTPRQWEALIQAVGTNAGACLDPPSATYPSWQLHVHPSPPLGGLLGSDYPAVARWDWDPQNNRHYIGIRCGDQWCEVSGSKFKSSISHPPGTVLPPEAVPNKPAPTQRQERRVIAIKGWYDEQRLAIAGAPGAPLTTGALTGTAIPHPLLGTLNLVDDFKDEWIPVATVVLNGPAGPYKAKLNLEEGRNQVYLCGSLSPTGCVPSGTPAPTGCTAEPDGRLWWTRIVSAGGETQYRCATRRTHPHEIPGTVRWRWLTDDETLWVRCSFGCCTVEP